MDIALKYYILTILEASESGLHLAEIEEKLRKMTGQTRSRQIASEGIRLTSERLLNRKRGGRKGFVYFITPLGKYALKSFRLEIKSLKNCHCLGGYEVTIALEYYILAILDKERIDKNCGLSSLEIEDRLCEIIGPRRLPKKPVTLVKLTSKKLVSGEIILVGVHNRKVFFYYITSTGINKLESFLEETRRLRNAHST